MKYLYLIFLITVSPSLLFAYDAENIRSFLKKNKNCSFAIYTVQKNKKNRNMFPQRLSDITCVGDITIGKGTIKEKQGCSIFNYDIERGTIKSIFRNSPVIVNKVCAEGGFDELLNLKFQMGLPYSNAKEIIEPLPENSKSGLFRLVVYSEKDEYRTKLGYPINDINLNDVDVKKSKK